MDHAEMNENVTESLSAVRELFVLIYCSKFKCLVDARYHHIIWMRANQTKDTLSFWLAHILNPIFNSKQLILHANEFGIADWPFNKFRIVLASILKALTPTPWSEMFLTNFSTKIKLNLAWNESNILKTQKHFTDN